MSGESGEPGTRAFGNAGVAERVREIVRYTPSGDTIPEETWESRHRKILALALAHLPLLLALGLFEGTESITGAVIPSWSPGVILGSLGCVLAFVLLANWSWFGRRTRTALATAALLTSSAIMVFFSGGFIEAHFHFFVMMAVVAVYEDWLPFLLGVAYVALQHGVFGTIDHSLVYNHEAAISNPWPWALIHATFILALSGALVAHWHSTERSREQTQSLEEKNAEIEAAKAEAEAARAEAEAREEELDRLNDHLESKARAYSAEMAAAAEGDLGVRLDPEGESEAMARIAESFNAMIEETATAVGEIQEFTGEVAAASEEASASVREVESASEDVTESIQSISRGADEQREKLEAALAELNDLSATVEEVASAADEVAETSDRTAAVAEDGERAARGAIEDVRAGRGAVGATVERVEQLDDRMAEIGEVIDLLGDIAHQTNMLALNANIEAARIERGSGSGEGDGEGFGVVADEIKRLAEETQQSAGEVEQLIEETQSETERAVEEAREADRYMEEGVEAVEAVVETLSAVADNTEETDSGVQEINRATDRQADGTEAIVSMVDEVTAISRQTAEEAEAVSAAAQQQASSTLQVSSGVDALAEEAGQLQTLLSKFEAGAAPDAAAPDPVVANDGGTPR